MTRSQKKREPPLIPVAPPIPQTTIFELRGIELADVYVKKVLEVSPQEVMYTNILILTFSDCRS